MVAVVTGLKKKIRDQWKLTAWRMGFNVVNPPHVVKQNTIVKYQQRTGSRVLIETGTYMGDMVFAQLNNFDRIYSIELSRELYERGLKRFREEPKVKLLLGDSGVRIDEIVTVLKEKAIFWLDGHYSGGITAQADKDCPVMEELQSIVKSPFDHTILIDDARLFNGKNDYPTLDEIRNIFKHHNKKYSIKIDNDVIVIQYVW
jgi:hypothetical protein